MDYSQQDDQTLLSLIVTAHEPALGALYDRYSRLVFSLAYQTVGDYTLAEEITQDVFLRVWEKADTFRPEQGRAATWLASIARNRAIDLYRRRSVRPEGNRADWDLESGPDLPDKQNVEAEAELAQRAVAVRQALRELPEEQRLVLTYAYFQGYSHSQIAETLNEPLGTVKTRIRLAMQKLRLMLAPESPSDG